jgi:hypothetical protein
MPMLDLLVPPTGWGGARVKDCSFWKDGPPWEGRVGSSSVIVICDAGAVVDGCQEGKKWLSNG